MKTFIKTSLVVVALFAAFVIDIFDHLANGAGWVVLMAVVAHPF